MPIRAVHQFPRRFLWGCSTAAHQVEGQNTNDWWRWEQTLKTNTDKAGRAADWWGGLYHADFDRAVELHHNTLRFSIEWSRIQPEPDTWDDWALDRYRDMLQALHDRGIKPLITLHHFTNPLWIADQNSWLWDQTPIHFERYVSKVVDRLGDLCSFWCTINAPNRMLEKGYEKSIWPPALSRRNTEQVALNLVNGHMRAYYAIKDIQPEAQVGYSLATAPRYNRALMERIIRDGDYKTLFRRITLARAKDTIDWIGVEGAITAQNVKAHAHRLFQLFGKPIYVTGLQTDSTLGSPAKFIETMRALWLTVNFNYPIRGVLVHSLIDGFEWEQGYKDFARCGLYAVDFASQARTARPIAAIYREMCELNGVSAEITEKYAPELLPTLFPGSAGQNNVTLKPRSKQSG